LGLSAVVAIGLFAADRTRAGEPAGWSGVKRDVSRLERDLDDVLLDSPNFLVSGHRDAHGIYLDEVGLILTFNGSIVQSRNSSSSWSWNGLNLGGGRVIIRDLSDDDDDDEDSYKEEDRDSKGNRTDRESRRARSREREERRYERGKEELVDFLMDSDDLIDGLRGGQWLMVVGCLDGSRVLDRKDLSRLAVKARVEDLKAHRAGSLSDEAFRSSVVVDEY